MNTEPAESTVLPHLAGAANDEVMPLQIDVTIESSTQPSGWTAFEVWRSRIKEVYEARVTLASGPHAHGTRTLARRADKSVVDPQPARSSSGPSAVQV